MFSRQHYVEIADSLKAIKPGEIHDCMPIEQMSMMEQWRYTVTQFAHVFEKDNPNFNRERFLNACSYD